MADETHPSEPPKRDWRPWAKWLLVVLVTAVIARYTGREAVNPPPPTVLPFEQK